jgi:hypothetical protein
MDDTSKRSEGLSTFTAIAFAVGTMVGAGVFWQGKYFRTQFPYSVPYYAACCMKSKSQARYPSRLEAATMYRPEVLSFAQMRTARLKPGPRERKEF